MNIDRFTRAYLEAALWSSCDEDGRPLDESYSLCDVAPESLAKAVADCAAFQTDNAAWLSGREQEGHDFWLTRNGHGAGFWDGDYPKDMGDALTLASHRFGETDLYVGDDSALHFSR